MRRHLQLCSAAAGFHSSFMTSSTDQPGTALLDFGFTEKELSKVLHKAPGIASLSQTRLEAILQYLLRIVTATKRVRCLVLRHPEALLVSVDLKAKPAVQFLKEVGLDDPGISSVLTRFPHVLGYGVKSDLIPQMHYLLSLGVTKEDLPGLIEHRPQVLSEYIEPVIRYLKVLGLKRTDIGQVLETYPIDYSLPDHILQSGLLQ